VIGNHQERLVTEDFRVAVLGARAADQQGGREGSAARRHGKRSGQARVLGIVGVDNLAFGIWKGRLGGLRPVRADVFPRGHQFHDERHDVSTLLEFALGRRRAGLPRRPPRRTVRRRDRQREGDLGIVVQHVGKQAAAEPLGRDVDGGRMARAVLRRRERNNELDTGEGAPPAHLLGLRCTAAGGGRRSEDRRDGDNKQGNKWRQAHVAVHETLHWTNQETDLSHSPLQIKPWWGLVGG